MSIGPWAFNGFDIIVLLVVFISLIMAASRGLFRELISITALVGALIVSLFVWGRFRFAAQDFIQPAQLADFALGAGTFALSYMLVLFVLSGATKNLRGKSVGLMDRLTGAGFGAGRGLIVASLAVMLMTANYREAKDMQSFSETMRELNQTLDADQRKMLEGSSPRWQSMMDSNEKVELPKMLQDSTLYPVLEKIGNGLRALPFARFKTMAEKLKEGRDLSEIAKEINQ